DWPVSRQLWWGHRIPVWHLHIPANANDDQWNAAFHWSDVDEMGDDDPEYSIQIIDKASGQRIALSGRDINEVDQYRGRELQVLLCKRRGDWNTEYERGLEQLGYAQDPDVLDTWFSSALWPHSTMGWPEKTPELAYWYPTSTLITSRDIITLWVARMVIMGQNNLDEIPFREVYIHPKILDGYGESMNKSLGNGVDPLDIVEKFGADALRFGLTALTTETQDVRMPVQFECPACQALVDQTKKNRALPKVACTKCGQEFSTQWAKSDADKALPRAAVVSERFEVARNFTNKLWNAARFALINLADNVSGSKLQVPGSEVTNLKPETWNLELTVEDRWLLSRLASVTAGVTESLKTYHYADAAKLLYDFAWDEFCSFYVEIAKARLADPLQKATAQRVLAHSLDTLLRLLHPLMPFITEEIWQLLNQVAPVRGLSFAGLSQGADAPRSPGHSPKWLIVAPWPEADLSWQNRETEARFALFQQALGAIREIRSRQNIATKNPLNFAIRCDAATADLLQPMAPYFLSMANATATALGPDAAVPPTNAKSSLAGMEVVVDLAGLIDVGAEVAKNEQLVQKLTGLITAKQGKLANESFVSRAPANVVQSERDSLAQMQEQLASAQTALAVFRKT
ncbi:MAG: class I tRNA ligase family protein, partial [Pirellulaceae bacterium]